MSEVVVEFIVPAIPVPQPRPRATIRGNHAAVYHPKNTPVEDFKATCRLAASEAYSGPPLDGPLRLDVEFVFPRPKAMFWKTKPMPRVWHTKKPDRDNVDKSLMDALSGLLWHDDSQVCDGRIQKWTAAGDEQPHARLVLSRA